MSHTLASARAHLATFARVMFTAAKARNLTHGGACSAVRQELQAEVRRIITNTRAVAEKVLVDVEPAAIAAVSDAELATEVGMYLATEAIRAADPSSYRFRQNGGWRGTSGASLRGTGFGSDWERRESAKREAAWQSALERARAA